MAQKRRTFLVNRNFQFRFSLYVCSWLIALNLSYLLIIWTLFDFIMNYLALDPMGPMIKDLEQRRLELVQLLIFMQVTFTAFSFIISIYMSHRIAGPLEKLRKCLQEVAETGKFGQLISFRKSDFFRELADDFNRMIERVKKDPR